ncbi:MAG: hypothetical protein V4590_03890 [Bacteroidota bacterium]
MKPQAWIYSTVSDGIFIIAPPFVSLAIIFLFPSLFQNGEGMSTISWVVLVLMIDVAHVYSTLFRTYLDRQEFAAQRSLFVGIPLISFVVAVLLYAIEPMYFWRVLAYLAVFHFIRQQYGFMRIYSRKENQQRAGQTIDTITIYAATLYPIVYWHMSSPRNFNWFIEGDFYTVTAAGATGYVSLLYLFVLAVYMVKELRFMKRTKYFNIPRNLLILGTALSWFVGIVYLNGDLSFTLLNVVSHGIPYMFLIWVYGKKKSEQEAAPKDGVQRTIYSRFGWLFFILIILGFAYFEEGLWDVLVWREHVSVFPVLKWLPAMGEQTLLTLIVPLLSLPQITHYIIDGYIWKLRKERS